MRKHSIGIRIVKTAAIATALALAAVITVSAGSATTRAQR